MPVTLESVWADLTKRIERASSASAERVVAYVLAQLGYNSAPSGRDATSIDGKNVIATVWKGTPFGDIVLFHGPSFESALVHAEEIRSTLEVGEFAAAGVGRAAKPAREAVYSRARAGGSKHQLQLAQAVAQTSAAITATATKAKRSAARVPKVTTSTRKRGEAPPAVQEAVAETIKHAADVSAAADANVRAAEAYVEAAPVYRSPGHAGHAAPFPTIPAGAFAGRKGWAPPAPVKPTVDKAAAMAELGSLAEMLAAKLRRK